MNVEPVGEGLLQGGDVGGTRSVAPCADASYAMSEVSVFDCVFRPR